MARILSIVTLILFPLAIMAQREKVVTGEYTYVFPDNVSLEQARATALERAQLKAIADEFGTIVSQSNYTYVRNENEQSTIDFQSLGGSDVKGEWIETIGEPKFENLPSTNGMQSVNCTVKGRAREIVSAPIDIIAKVLRNGTEEKFEDYDFKDGDDMYLFLKSPKNGYLAVYLIDETERYAYCLLPYEGSDGNVQKIKHDQEYVFFSKDKASDSQKSVVDEYFLTCKHDGGERNDLYIIFSSKPFDKASSSIRNEALADGTTRVLPLNLPIEKFNKWFFELRKHNETVVTMKKIITIRKNY